MVELVEGFEQTVRELFKSSDPPTALGPPHKRRVGDHNSRVGAIPT